MNQNTNENSSEDRKNSKDKSKEKNKVKKHQSSKKNIPSHKGVSPRKSLRKTSVDSNEERNILPKNIDNLRPPQVWNYPIERIEKLKNDLKKKKEDKEGGEIDLIRHEKKNTIRKVNPYICYHDKRLERFMVLFNELFENSMKYSYGKGNIWEYTYGKILHVFGIDYIFPIKNEKGEEKKEEEKNENEEKNEELNLNNDNDILEEYKEEEQKAE